MFLNNLILKFYQILLGFVTEGPMSGHSGIVGEGQVLEISLAVNFLTCLGGQMVHSMPPGLLCLLSLAWNPVGTV